MRIGFIGHVGAKLAGSLLRGGFDLIVRDFDLDAGSAEMASGAKNAENGLSLAEASDVVIANRTVAL